LKRLSGDQTYDWQLLSDIVGVKARVILGWKRKIPSKYGSIF